MKMICRSDTAQLYVLNQFDLSFGAICSEYIRRNFGRKPQTHVNARNAAASFGRASLSTLGDHGHVLGRECDFWPAGGW